MSDCLNLTCKPLVLNFSKKLFTKNKFKYFCMLSKGVISSILMYLKGLLRVCSLLYEIYSSYVCLIHYGDGEEIYFTSQIFQPFTIIVYYAPHPISHVAYACTPIADFVQLIRVPYSNVVYPCCLLVFSELKRQFLFFMTSFFFNWMLFFKCLIAAHHPRYHIFMENISTYVSNDFF